MQRLSKAFTWVDLIVLLSLVCIAVAILFPVFSQHSRVSSHNVCMSNMKQLGLAFEQYVQDNDSHYPVGPGTHRGGGWAGAVYPYVRSAGVYHCSGDLTEADMTARSPRMPVSYAFNAFLAQSNKETVRGVAVRGLSGASRKVKEPSRTIMLFEVSGSRAVITDTEEGGSERDRTSLSGDGLTLVSYDGKNTEHAGDNGKVGGTMPGGARYVLGRLHGWNHGPLPAQWANEARHDGGANYAYADGHVRYWRPGMINIVDDGTRRSFWAQK